MGWFFLRLFSLVGVCDDPSSFPEIASELVAHGDAGMPSWVLHIDCDMDLVRSIVPHMYGGSSRRADNASSKRSCTGSRPDMLVITVSASPLKLLRLESTGLPVPSKK